MVSVHFSVRICGIVKVRKCNNLNINNGALRGLAVWRTGTSVYREIHVNVFKHMCALFVSKSSKRIICGLMKFYKMCRKVATSFRWRWRFSSSDKCLECRLLSHKVSYLKITNE